jgi:hypothetical protein
VTLPPTVRTRLRARLRRVAVAALLLPALLAGSNVAAAAISPPTIAGPTGPVNSPPSYTITGDPAAHIDWAVCPDGSINCVQGMGDGQTVTGPLPSGAASTADGLYLLSATQTLGVDKATAVVSFTLDRSAPPVPTNVRSTGAAGASRPSFAWTPAEPGGTFNWDIRSAGAIGGPAADSGSATTGAATVGTALADGSYTFRVHQLDAAGNAGPWSAPVTVTAGAPPPPPPPPPALNPPEITSPTPDPANASPIFTWRTGTAPGVDSFSWQITDAQTVVVVGPTTTTDTQATVASPLAPGAYSFRVVEIDPSGARSAAARMDFTVAESPAPPSVTGLVLTPGVAQIGLVWTLTPAPEIAGVRVMRRVDGPPTGPLDAAATAVELAADARSYVDPGLVGGSTYYYAVYARSSAGVFSAVAATGSATAQAAFPAPVTPPLGLNDPPAPPPPTQPAATAQSVTKPKPKPTVKPKPRTPAKASTQTLTLNTKRLRPGAGVSVRFLQPQLRWNDRSRGVVLYNLQIFDAKGHKLHKAFPAGRKYIVPPNILRPGHRYYWRVWPWYGPVRKFAAKPLGISYFQVKGPIIPQ